jgi:hypothetical protein
MLLMRARFLEITGRDALAACALARRDLGMG